MASITRSMPFPGPSSPHVSNVGRLPGDTVVDRGGTKAPCEIVVTLSGPTSKPAQSRRLAASDITTTRSAMAATASSTER